MVPAATPKTGRTDLELLAVAILSLRLGHHPPGVLVPAQPFMKLLAVTATTVRLCSPRAPDHVARWRGVVGQMRGAWGILPFVPSLRPCNAALQAALCTGPS